MTRPGQADWKSSFCTTVPLAIRSPSEIAADVVTWANELLETTSHDLSDCASSWKTLTLAAFATDHQQAVKTTVAAVRADGGGNRGNCSASGLSQELIGLDAVWCFT